MEEWAISCLHAPAEREESAFLFPGWLHLLLQTVLFCRLLILNLILRLFFGGFSTLLDLLCLNLFPSSLSILNSIKYFWFFFSLFFFNFLFSLFLFRLRLSDCHSWLCLLDRLGCFKYFNFFLGYIGYTFSWLNLVITWV